MAWNEPGKGGNPWNSGGDKEGPPDIDKVVRDLQRSVVHYGDTTLFFAEQMAGRAPEDYLIRVNRQPAAEAHVLREGDRVSITPTKIHGA